MAADSREGWAMAEEHDDTCETMPIDPEMQRALLDLLELAELTHAVD